MKKSILCLGMALLTFAGNASNTILEKLETTEVVAKGATPLCVAISKGETEIVKKFVEYGADVNEESNGMTPLMIAARYNRTEIIEILLANGAHLGTKNEKGFTALKYAELSNATAAVDMLTNAGRK